MTTIPLHYTDASPSSKGIFRGRVAQCSAQKRKGLVRAHAATRAAAWSRQFLATALAAMLVASTALANTSAQDLPDVTNMSVEDLMQMQVTSVSKRAQSVADAPAAIFVISQEDIQNSGAR
ncbi:MAG TPA: hypothetical protein VFP96_00340, partial [Candidatus Acidoferrum sp.]|nr:hypothetical protein [Candidatus Acidoferrum sp.]